MDVPPAIKGYLYGVELKCNAVHGGVLNDTEALVSDGIRGYL